MAVIIITITCTSVNRVKERGKSMNSCIIQTWLSMTDHIDLYAWILVAMAKSKETRQFWIYVRLLLECHELTNFYIKSIWCYCIVYRPNLRYLSTFGSCSRRITNDDEDAWTLSFRIIADIFVRYGSTLIDN